MIDHVDASLATLGLSKAAIIGGFFGSLVSLKFIENLNVWQRISTVMGGMFCASFVTPLVLHAFDLSQRTEGAISFLVGLFGMSIVAAAVKAIPDVVTKTKEKWLS